MADAESAKWYVVHTYSGYENKVKADIEKTIENRKLQDQILEVSVPVEESIEVLHPYDAFFLRFAHEVADGVAFRHVEVEICFHTATVSMCRHGVPYTTRFQFCQSHLQLARTFFKYVVNNQLVDNAVVAFFHLSCRERICFQRTFASVDGDQLSFVLLVSSSGVDIEFCRFAGIFALESNFLLASASNT